MDSDTGLVPDPTSPTGNRLSPGARLTAALIGEVMIAESDGLTHARIAEILRDLAADLVETDGDSEEGR